MLSRQTISKSSVNGTKGAVAAARQRSAEVAAELLAAGGNAVDAGVSAALVAGVIEPMETTLGGSGFMLIGVPGEGSVHSVEFGPRAPLAARSDMFQIDSGRHVERGLGISIVVGDANVQGITSVGVPATLRGLLMAQERFGRLPRPRVMRAAIVAAYEGFHADSYFALEALANLAALRADPGARALFLIDDLPPVAPHLGTASLGIPVLIRQQALGRTLELIADRGVDSLYEGELASSLLTTVAELGGLLSRQDLMSCAPVITKARSIRFRDAEVWASNAPCGAVTQLQMLQIWQALYPERAPLEDTPQRVRDLAATSWHAFADRYHWLGDPDFVAVPEDSLVSAAYAADVARAIRAGHPPPRTSSADSAPWNHFASRAVHDPWPHQPGRPARPPVWKPGGSTEPTAGTTHVSVIDAQGMAVSITHTAANHFGSKVVCPRTGLLLDAAMGWFNALPNAANSIAGGKRPLANMGPMLITRAGSPIAAIGAPGGRRILNAMVQIVINLVERDMSAEDAVHAPRVDASGAGLLASERLAAVIDEIPELRGAASLVSEQHEGFGYELARPNIALRDRNGATSAASDPFSRGYAVAN